MKKLIVSLSIVLCLVLCAFAFTSCGKKKPAATTGAETAPATTRAEQTTEEATTAPEPDFPVHQHVPEDEYCVLSYPTCTTPGREVLYCAECGDEIEEREIPIDPNAHDVEWNVTKQPTLLDPTGHRTGQCSHCAQSFDEDTAFEHNVQTFTSSSSGDYYPASATLGEIRGGEHFYPTDADPEGIDLLVEYSVLWNETLLNFDVSNGRMPTIDTRFTPNKSGTNGNSGIVRWELANDTTSEWCTCKFAGGFEVAHYETSEPDSPYPRFGLKEGVDSTAYPNIGGANLGDGRPHGEMQWGWHRVSIRYREELTNPNEVKAGSAEATYFLQVWVYIDGTLVLHNSGNDHKWGGDGSDRKLFSAANDGEGGIKYTENDHLYLHGAFLDSVRTNQDTKSYFEIADYSATIGHDFVQDVCKVYNPVETAMEVEEGVSVPTTMWYTLVHNHVPEAEYTVDLAPTCTVPGSKSYHCTICGAIIADSVTPIEPTASAGHTPAEDYTIDAEPTCSALGSKSKHCTVCGEIIPETVESIDMIAHTPATEYTVDVAPTCSAVGSKSKHCTVCNTILADTVTEVPIDPTAHSIPEGTITVTPTLLADGKKTGECELCHNAAEVSVTYEPPIIALREGQKTKFTADPKTLGDIRGENHYYEAGNDLLIEYSILWDEAFLGMRQTSSTITAVETRLATNATGTSNNHAILRLNLDDDTQSEWVYCKYAGGIEVGAWGTGNSELDNPYPRFDQNNADVTAYPNIGGANAGDGQPLGDTQWGWHRVSIRYREEVTNVDAVKAGEAATYKLTMWVYVDGVLVLHFSDSDHMRNGVSYKLFTAESDGEGGITYVENDALYLHGAFMDSTRLEDGKNPGYSSIADYSVTVGTDFVQNVKKVTNPTETTWEIASGVFVPSTMWYELAD